MLTAITGASGHVGINLTRALAERGRSVRVLAHRNRRILDEMQVEVMDADILDINSLFRAFEGVGVVYHLAARISILMDDWGTCRRHNIEGTQNVIEACRRSGVKRLVHFSSIHALCQQPYDETLDESRAFISKFKCPPYDRSKAKGEQMVKEAVNSGLDAIIINPTGILGPNDYEPSFLGEALMKMALGKYPILVGGGFNWVDVRDVVDGAIKAEQTAPPSASYLLSGHYLSVREIANMAARILGRKPPTLVCPLGPAKLFAPMVTAYARLTGQRPLFTTASLNALDCNRHISHARATRELDYRPRPIESTLRDTLQWFRDNGYLEIN
jgi:dihydroflavonol-4-reductase